MQNRNSEGNKAKDPCAHIRPPSTPAHQSLQAQVHYAARQPITAGKLLEVMGKTKHMQCHYSP